jgi:protein-S-isoprenylcysteine O-methyltransferase Ste14
MTIYARLILALWLALFAIWGVMAFGAKRSVGARAQWKQSGVRLTIAVLVFAVIRIPGLRHALRSAEPLVRAPLAGLVGLTLCTLGVALAVWARLHLGRNWGPPMSHKADPELVTSGPYALIRHPIYTGFILAALGSAIGENPFWFLLLIVFGGYFIASARREEKLMIEQFPDRYPAYMARTHMLLPFVL